MTPNAIIPERWNSNNVSDPVETKKQWPTKKKIVAKKQQPVETDGEQD